MIRFFLHNVLLGVILTLLVIGFFYFHGINKANESIINEKNISKIFANQNTDTLIHEIPSELQNLDYGLYPINCEYDAARFNFNKRFNVFPHAIFFPRNPQEAAFVLKILKKHSLDFSIRSGGYSDEPASLSSGYIIDMRKFNSIKLSPNQQEAYIGASCQVHEVIEKLGTKGFLIPVGYCLNVGTAGLALGGGVGVLSRPYGLTCDSLKSITMLNANAEVIEINEQNQPDLFWALRGAGNGSYGIVLGFTFNVHKIPPISYYKLTWDWDSKNINKIIQAWQAWIQKLPENISSRLQLQYTNGNPTIAISGIKTGKDEFTEWEKAFKELNPKVEISDKSYLESVKDWGIQPLLPFYKAKSKMMLNPVSNEVIQKTVNFFEGLKKDQAKYHVIFSIEALGGAVSKSKPTSFFPRDASALWYQAIYWNDQSLEASALNYINTFYEDVSPSISKYSYVNAVDYDLGKDYLEAYYGDHVDRLIEIKKKNDPDNLFHWKQSIPLKK
jgi:FAD/FMN-containing dehydrogenase